MNTKNFIELGIYCLESVKNDCKNNNVELSDSELFATVITAVLNEYNKLLMEQLKTSGIEIEDVFNGEAEYAFPKDVLKHD
ncbi:MAG: hypothetical protein ACI4J7_08810 [Ruminiclostridium sp.]